MPEELFDTSNALGYLRAEHETIEQLLVTLTTVEDMDFARQVKTPLLQELRVHAEMEREFFYPYMSERVGDTYVRRPEDDNKQIDELTKKLESLDPEDPLFNESLDKLIKTFNHHVFWEEEELFLRVEGKDPDTHNDLIRIANAMKRRRADLLAHIKANTASQAGSEVSKGDLQLRLAQERGRGLDPERDVLTETEKKALERGSMDVKATSTGELESQGGRQIDIVDPTAAQAAVDSSSSNLELVGDEYRVNADVPIEADSAGVKSEPDAIAQNANSEMTDSTNIVEKDHDKSGP